MRTDLKNRVCVLYERADILANLFFHFVTG